MSLRKVFGQINGVTIEKMPRKEAAKDEKQAIIKSIERGYTEVKMARRNGEKLPDLDGLIMDLKSSE